MYIHIYIYIYTYVCVCVIYTHIHIDMHRARTAPFLRVATGGHTRSLLRRRVRMYVNAYICLNTDVFIYSIYTYVYI